MFEIKDNAPISKVHAYADDGFPVDHYPEFEALAGAPALVARPTPYTFRLKYEDPEGLEDDRLIDYHACPECGSPCVSVARIEGMRRGVEAGCRLVHTGSQRCYPCFIELRRRHGFGPYKAFYSYGTEFEVLGRKSLDETGIREVKELLKGASRAAYPDLEETGWAEEDYELPLLIDCDGVLADFMGGLFIAAGVEPFEYDRWDVLSRTSPLGTPSVVAEMARAEGFCRNLPAYPNIEPAFKILRKLGIPFKIVTSPYPGSKHWHSERVEWLLEHVPGLHTGDIIFASDKRAVPGLAIIEDRYKNAFRWSKTHERPAYLLGGMDVDIEKAHKGRFRLGTQRADIRREDSFFDAVIRFIDERRHDVDEDDD